jgi:predicted  nucleic acid-binding Zn-ribbon protein
MKRYAFATLLLCIFALNIAGQDATPCPADRICITREAAIAAAEAAKERDALKLQKTADDKAFDDLRKELNEVRVRLGFAQGEATALRQNAVQDRAIIAELLKSTKKKCYPFTLICL